MDAENTHTATNTMPESTYYGSIVAFEGNNETISTQLQLLPKAPQILVLPPIHAYMPKNKRRQLFDARRCIREIHQAAEARFAAARDFLRDSTPENKKLVFLNGGTVGGQVLCLAAISENQTAGSMTRADVIFSDLVKDGVAGLAEDYQERRSRMLELGSPSRISDPITMAMRAAEKLDSETASLQPSNDLDLTSYSMWRRRSLSQPIYRYSEHMEGAVPFYVFGARQEWDVMPSGTSKYNFRDDMSIRSPRAAVDERPHQGNCLFPPKSPSCNGESWRQSAVSVATADLLSLNSDFFGSRAATPDPVVYGEACAVRLRPRSSPVVKRRSSSADLAAVRRRLSHLESLADGRRLSKLSLSADPELSSIFGLHKKPEDGHSSHGDRPQTVFVRGRRCAGLSLMIPTSRLPVNKRSSCVDRGTDVDEHNDMMTFKPVLPLTEDLVIYFSNSQQHDEVLEHVFQAFKDGRYPIQRSIPTSETEAHVSLTPKSPHAAPELQKFSWETEPSFEITVAPMEADEHDTFASQGDFQYCPNARVSQPAMVSPTITRRRPNPPDFPPPENTHPPSITVRFERKLHEFNTNSCPTAVSMQNSLRSILNQYFPPEERGYHQCNFPLLPDSDGGLWQPIFRETDGPASRGKVKSRMDQIIAIGYQNGVKKEFVSTVTGQLEMLGSKHNGISRSGRLDLRYLIASAMQVFTAQPLANQTQDNPFTNPYLLATLIIPHLETYLAMNPTIRFLLIEYPPEHLSTALALQKLIGVDLFKVAGIINADKAQRRPSTPVPQVEGLSAISLTAKRPPKQSASSSLYQPVINTVSAQCPNSMGGSASSLHLTFSNANFLLASSASEKELATFVYTIWKILTVVSSSYSVDQLPLNARMFLAHHLSSRDLLSPPGSAGSRSSNSRMTAPGQERCEDEGSNIRTSRAIGDTKPRRQATAEGKFLLSSSASPCPPTYSSHQQDQKQRQRSITPTSIDTSFPAWRNANGVNASSSKTQLERLKSVLAASPPAGWLQRRRPRKHFHVRFAAAAGDSVRNGAGAEHLTARAPSAAANDDGDGTSSFFDFGDDYGNKRAMQDEEEHEYGFREEDESDDGDDLREEEWRLGILPPPMLYERRRKGLSGKGGGKDPFGVKGSIDGAKALRWLGIT